MLPVDPGIERIDLSEHPSHLVVEIWRERSLYMFVALGIWILGFLALSGTVFLQLMVEPGAYEYRIYHLLFGGAWLLVLMAAIFSWLWNFRGSETISVGPAKIVHEKKAPLYRRRSIIYIDSIERVSVIERGLFYPFWWRRIEYWGFGGGGILVELANRNQRMGMLLDELNARPIVAKMKEQINAKTA